MPPLTRGLKVGKYWWVILKIDAVHRWETTLLFYLYFKWEDPFFCANVVHRYQKTLLCPQISKDIAKSVCANTKWDTLMQICSLVPGDLVKLFIIRIQGQWWTGLKFYWRLLSFTTNFLDIRMSYSHNLKSKNLKAFAFQFFSTFYVIAFSYLGKQFTTN